MPNFTQVNELLQQGIAAAKAGRTQEAHQALLQVTELDERNELAWLWLSGVVDSLEERRICLENVLAINPDNGYAQAGLRWLDSQVSAPHATQEHCPRCQAPVPPSGTTCPHCGQILIVACPACGQYVDVSETSCPECEQPLGDFRKAAHYHLSLAQAYLERQQRARAQEAAARAEAEASGDSQVLAGVAALHAEMGNSEAAIATYKRAIERDPENAALYASIGAIYRQCAMSAEARAMYQQAVARAGDDPEILFELAQLHVEEDGATPEALKLLERTIRLKPQHAQAHLLLSDACLDLGRRNKAIRHCEQACKLISPDSQTGQKARRKLAELRNSRHKPAQTRRATLDQPSCARPRERPGCVTAYAILLGICAGLIALAGIAAGIGLMAPRRGIATMGLATTAIAFVVAALYFLLARGLWNLKNWARIIVIVIQTLGWLSNLLSVYGALTISSYGLYTYQGDPIPIACGAVFGLALGAYTIYWFVAHRECFD